MNELKRSFGYERIVTKERLQQKKERPNKQRASNSKQTLLRIWHAIDEKRGALIAVLFLVLISSLLTLAGPFLLGRVIDEYIVPGTWDGLSTQLLLLIGIYAALSLSMYTQNVWMIDIAQQTIYKLRTDLFAHLQRLPIPFFDKKQHGELMSRLTNDIETISQTLNSSFIQVFSSVITLTGTVAVMLYLSPLLTVLTMTIIPMMFLAMRWITRRTSILFKEQQRTLGELNGFVQESISGQEMTKTYAQERRMIEQFDEKSAALQKTGYWALVYSGFIPKTMNFLNNFSFAIVAGVGGWLALSPASGVTVGVIVVFAEYARQFTRPLNDLANQFNTVLSALAGAERVFELMDEPQERDEGLVLPPNHIRGDVRFDRVTFSYGKETILNRVSFEARAGETHAFIGPTGAGKTTIMQLIAQFYDPIEGTIYFDEHRATDLSRRSIRDQLAFVLQDAFLFETTIRENIRYGRLDATDEEIVQAAKQANAHSFIERLPEGYDTVIAADGEQLAQGERQLLSIARAFVADPAILLLDEATSSIDTVTEMHIQEALLTLMKDRTSFVIAHRLNTIEQADVIHVLRDGVIVESGSPHDLLERRGMYYDMVQTSRSNSS
ncbi:ATP-binding cassette domain-containing protein [Planococcaceae bacterium Storch 2/2-2]|nr:ATP-binding cassette domain-containing protein [Planococcaceae bacterium Storch 2/2-2]